MTTGNTMSRLSVQERQVTGPISNNVTMEDVKMPPHQEWGHEFWESGSIQRPKEGNRERLREAGKRLKRKRAAPAPRPTARLDKTPASPRQGRQRRKGVKDVKGVKGVKGEAALSRPSVISRHGGQRRKQALFALFLGLILITGALLIPESPPPSLEPKQGGAAAWSSLPAVQTDLRYGEEPPQVFDLHLPPTPGPHPTIVFAHSGGWSSGSKENVVLPIREAMKLGWAVASVNYTLSTEEEPFSADAATGDILLATHHLKVNADTYGLDADRFIAAGESAGGHLALLAANTAVTVGGERTSQFVGVINIVGPLDAGTFYDTPAAGFFRFGAVIGCADPAACSDEELQRFSPVGRVGPHSPPTYVIIGETDEVANPQQVESYVQMFSKVSRYGHDGVWVDTMDGQGHNFPRSDIRPNQFRLFLSLAEKDQFI